MHKLFLPLHTSLPAAQAVMTRAMRLLARYLIPSGIALISIVALLSWHNQYAFTDNLPLHVRVLAEDAATPTPAAALAALRNQAPVSGFSTHLVDTPFWFSIDTVHRVGGPEVLEFPSRHAVQMACWDTAGMTLLGTAAKNTVSTAEFATLVPAKAGFALRLTFMPAKVLCRGTFAGPARLTVVQWPADQFALSIDQYHRKSGLLDGGMIVLALFVLICAAIYREIMYVVFAAWLVINLRLGAISAGWDVQWLGQLVPPVWLAVSRSTTVVLYGILTMGLYQMLLRDYLVSLRQRLALRFVQWMCLPTFMAAFLLPYRLFVPIIWVIVVAGVTALCVDLVRIMMSARTRVALYFTAALAISFAAGVSEIIAGAFDLRELAGAIDSVTAALASSLLAALAVTEQMRVERSRKMALQEQLRETWNASPAGLFTLDLDGRFLAGNAALAAMLGTWGVADSRWQQYFTDDAWRRLRQLLAAGQSAELEIAQMGRDRRFMARAVQVSGRIEGVLENITEQSREIDQLRLLAHSDPMTGVFNRRGMEQVFEGAAGALAAGRPMALAFIDFDRYKLINDVFGRAAGDEVLRQACERIAGVLADGQHLGRIGGDTFLVALPDTSMAVAALICRGIVERVGNTPYLVGDKAFRVRAALGLVEVVQGMPWASAVASAERACRVAKTAAGDGVHGDGSSAAALAGHEAEMKLIARLSTPNATVGMFLDMQPVKALAAPAAQIVDVVLRMREADGSIVAAERIVAAAERSGRAGVIDRWVLANTLEWIARQAGQLPAPHCVCMKLSVAALNDEHFVQSLLASLRQYAHIAPLLCLAIPEQAALLDLENTSRFSERVRAFGVKIALDDCGAGPSPLPSLKAFPVDLIKIDGALVAGIAHPANAAAVAAIVCLAEHMGMQTVAAGAHDRATLHALARAGIDYVQGDSVARTPLPGPAGAAVEDAHALPAPSA